MSSMNRATVVGRIGQDAELRHTSSGTAVANFSMATEEAWTDKAGQRQKRTEWHRIVVWDRQAESLAQYLLKGALVGVDGKLQTREWQDRDGNKRYTTEIRADRIALLARPPQREQQAQGGYAQDGYDQGGYQPQAQGGGATLDEDDIPF